MNLIFDVDVGFVDSILIGFDFLFDDVFVLLLLYFFEEEYDFFGGKVNGEFRNELLEYCLIGGLLGF